MQKHEDRKVNRNATGEVCPFFFVGICSGFFLLDIFVLTNSEMKIRHKYRRHSTKEDDHLLLLPGFHRDCVFFLRK